MAQHGDGASEALLRRVAIALCLAAVVLDVLYIVLSRGVHDQPGLSTPVSLDLGQVTGALCAAFLGLLLVWARPSNPIGWWIGAVGLFLAMCNAGQTYGARAVALPDEHLPLATLSLSLSAPLWIPAVFLPASLILVRYPSGAIRGRWPRRFSRAAEVGFVVLWVGYACTPNSVTDVVTGRLPPEHLPHVIAVTFFALGGVLVFGATLLIVGDAVRRTVRGERSERLALLWLLLSACAAVVLIIVGPAGPLGGTAFMCVLLAVAIGVWRYQALGIEVVLRRTLVYATLTVLVLLVFVGVVAVLAQVLPEGPVPALVAACLIAVGLAPARERVQRLVDRLLYGVRDPVSALQELASPLGGEHLDENELSGAMLAALGEALHVRGVAITVRAPEGGRSETWGSPEETGTPTVVPLSFGSQPLGELRVWPRAGESRLGRADRRLLESVAPMVAAVLHATALTEDLRRERGRVIEATSVERARLRQELHDGLGPSLTGIGLGLDAAASKVTDRSLTDLVARLRHEVTAALEETRRIIDDLRPVALDDGDLVAAVRRRTEQVSSAGVLEVVLEVADDLGPVPDPVASAAYRIVDEALTNVVRHACARRCRVRIMVDGGADRLCVEVCDDGVGLGPARGTGTRTGVGLASMRERAERLGGRFCVEGGVGTTVNAELPLRMAR
jgi:signal transduction histidine kinase